MDVEKFIRMIDSNLNSIEGDSVNALANLAINVIVGSLDEVAPRRKVILRDRWQGKQWFSDAIRQIIKQRDETYKLARISKSEKDWDLFRQLRNKVVDECRKAKSNYLELRLDKNKKDPRRMWGTLKEILKGNSYSDNIYREIQCDDIMINDIYEMANIFNKYLVNSLSMTVEDDYAMEVTMEKYTESQFEVFNVIDVDELKRIVSRLENKSGTEEGITELR